MMIKISWGLAESSVWNEGGYKGVYSVEADIGKLYGSNNFSGFGDADWFLIEKETKKLAFMMLTVPSLISLSDEGVGIEEIDPVKIHLDELIRASNSIFKPQKSASLSLKSDILIVADEIGNASGKLEIGDSFFILLNERREYIGFFLDDPLSKFSGYSENKKYPEFSELFTKVVKLCSKEAYQAMEVGSKEYEFILNDLQNKLFSVLDLDPRVENLIDFIKSMKFSFYDTEC